MRKILIVNQNAGYLTIDVANVFFQSYDEVVLMYGKIRITDRTLDPRIKIQSTIGYDRSSTLKRLWTWGLCTIHLLFLVVLKYRNHHILYYSNPPISHLVSLFVNNTFSVVVFDVFPDALRLVQIKESNFFYRIWAAVNSSVYPNATQIITLSEGMKKQLMRYVPEEKIKVVSIWPASENFKPIPKRENPFLKTHGWEHKFIVLYSGNMGIGHKLEVLIEVAEELKEQENILFLFIGEGAKKKTLQKLTIEKSLKNVSFLTWQDSSILPYSLAAGDVSVVSLEPNATHAGVPSKTFNYLAVGSPIIGIGNDGSALDQLIKSNEVGFYLNGKNLNELIDCIIHLKDKREILNNLSKKSLEVSRLYNYSLSRNYI
ncbi:glycosyltransferase family 4 protein [Lunatibacter salilacus]|uniref:glycosyltransferase family 4 protein n=1 Tax=Lunatibacter salilacus TaxID=2483804 RepID=UPI00131B151E|nr:glycosyltransferase family 4 protein [Lunatibacter salilacus]